MPNITDLNGVAVASITDINGVVLANIAGINGLTVSTFSGLLDDYSGAATAYSTRRLNSAYTGAAMRVREDGTDTETDIGFDSNGDLDTAAISTHCGVNNGYVVTWYDQATAGGTGSGDDATNATTSGQPQIYNGSSVITTNGKPSLLHVSDSNWLSRPTNITGTVTNFYVFIAADTNYSLHGGGTNLLATSGSSSSAGTTTGLYINNVQFTGSTRGDLYTAFGTSQVLSSDNVRVGDPIEGLSIFGYKASAGAGFNFASGNVQEVVTWNSDQSSNRTGINGNINAHYQIGNFGTPTSGLLATYTGAAAAYSVRQLANTAALAMRVREDGTDTELDIGFDSNGDLDTAAIASHCGANNGYVVTWYDQSGNQVDATQGTTTSQPQIYNGAAVITENGKPAVDFDGSNDQFPLSLSGLNINNLSAVTVCQSDVTSGNRMQFTLNSGSNARYWHYMENGSDTMWYGGTTRISHGAMNTSQRLRTFIAGSTSTVARSFLNGTEAGTTLSLVNATLSANEQFLGNYHTGSFYWDGTMQEFIVWGADQFNNRTGIETDINTYFSIY